MIETSFALQLLVSLGIQKDHFVKENLIQMFMKLPFLRSAK